MRDLWTGEGQNDVSSDRVKPLETCIADAKLFFLVAVLVLRI